jgi:intracellular sulfur oxidation DsrE/DsrF family protein
MATHDLKPKTHRRGFLGSLATGAAATFGMASLLNPLQLNAKPGFGNDISEADQWFKKIKGKHRIVYDVTAPNGIMPFAWAKVFLLTNAATGTPETDCSVVVVLRHDAIPYALESDLWAKYKLGEMFKINDDKAKTPAQSNPFWQRPTDTVPGIGAVQIGIDVLQKSGVMFAACDMAMTVYSAVAAGTMGGNADPAAIKKEWVAGVLPGIQVVPSGVWAVGRAQEHGCAYCYAGGAM